MEGRVRRNGVQGSPERYMVWTEPAGKRRMQWQQSTEVPVVYYLCKDSLLEHPHFIEVPFSSTKGLYLRDVMNRLVVLRGNQMPAMYSWSCKRSYRNGFVWQDLAKDDLILPAQGNYILKGSLLPDQIPADTLLKNSSNQVLQKNQGCRQTERILYSRKVEASSCSSPASTPSEMMPLCPPHQASPHPRGDYRSLPFSHSSITVITSSGSSDCRDFMPTGALAFSNQTEDTGGRKVPEPSTQTTILSLNNELSPSDFNEIRQKYVRSIDGVMEETSRTPARWNTRIDTLMSLIRAEVNQDGFRGGTEKCLYHQSKEKIKRTNALFHLITCRLFLEKINIT